MLFGLFLLLCLSHRYSRIDGRRIKKCINMFEFLIHTYFREFLSKILFFYIKTHLLLFRVLCFSSHYVFHHHHQYLKNLMEFHLALCISFPFCFPVLYANDCRAFHFHKGLALEFFLCLNYPVQGDNAHLLVFFFLWLKENNLFFWFAFV